MMEAGTHSFCPLVYRGLRNRMGLEYLNNVLVYAVSKETFDKSKDDEVMKRFKL
ncbi:hypothetical protein HanIR_Chr13g0667921 [Helianthus annuus]|nr:hypothetical protein HanIR_Chr13g0667921 [Helianthus annuus]